jgi:hypothetical protein
MKDEKVYEVGAAGFWLEQARGNRGQPPNLNAIALRQRKFREKCLKTQATTSGNSAASSSCTMSTATR